MSANASGSSGRRITGTLQEKDLLKGRYRIVRQVGKGGFGVVYQATDETFRGRRIVAIKELSDSQLDPAKKTKAIEDFAHEADMLVSLRHHNLPDVSDRFIENGKAYLVMEFIEGRTLEKILEDNRGPLDEQRVMHWALQLCDVLSYLHTQPDPIIFRDMKPSNVMVTRNNWIKLIDFGIARTFKARATKDTELLGSPVFASPEQFGLGQTDARSDIYSLGATLYNLLTNEDPLVATTRLVHVGSLVPPSSFSPGILPITEQIVLKALEVKPQDRYQSADEMSQAILASGLVGPSSQIVQPGLQPITGKAAPAGGGPQMAGGMGAGGGQGPPGGQQFQGQGGQMLVGAGQQPVPQRVSRRGILLGGVAVAAATGGYLLLRTSGKTNTVTSTGPLLPVPFVYSTEKAQWLEAAIEAFNKSKAATFQGKTIRIQPQSSGSLDLAQAILRGDVEPVIWSPASSLEIDQLASTWQQKHTGQDILVRNDIQSLVLSPLVFAVWEDRAKVLLNTYRNIDWNSIYQALQLPNGWADIGGSPDWQHVKLGQTRADTSNSGLLSITLMTYACFKKAQGLTIDNINDPRFTRYFRTFEDAVNAFGRSSGTYLQQDVLVKGPAAYEIVPTYENLVLTAQDEVKQRQPQRLLPFYSHVNILSDHPFVFLKGIWVRPEAQAAAKRFRDFLLDLPQQQLALRYGLRPTHPQVHISDKTADNLFISTDIRSTIRSDFISVQLPGGAEVKALIDLWVRSYGDAATGNG